MSDALPLPPLWSANTTSGPSMGGPQVFFRATQSGQAGARHTGTVPRRRRSWSSTICRLLFDIVTRGRFAVTSRAQLVAENAAAYSSLSLQRWRRSKPCRPQIFTVSTQTSKRVAISSGVSIPRSRSRVSRERTP
jgi:hypothetical protein